MVEKLHIDKMPGDQSFFKNSMQPTNACCGAGRLYFMWVHEIHSHEIVSAPAIVHTHYTPGPYRWWLKRNLHCTGEIVCTGPGRDAVCTEAVYEIAVEFLPFVLVRQSSSSQGLVIVVVLCYCFTLCVHFLLFSVRLQRLQCVSALWELSGHTQHLQHRAVLRGGRQFNSAAVISSLCLKHNDRVLCYTYDQLDSANCSSP